MPYPLLLHAKHHPNATYQPFGEWIVPWRFQSVETEYQTLRTAVGLIDYSTQALIELRGADRVSFLQNLLTNDVQRLAPGTGCQAALLTSSAKLIADLFVFAERDALWLLCDASRASVVAQTLDRYLFSEQLTITNHERREAVFALQGPKTVECLTQLLGGAVALAQPGDHVVAQLQGIPLRVIRHTVTGLLGVLCVCPAEHAQTAWEVLGERGGVLGLKLVGWEALNVSRIEAGIPWFGIDMDESNLLPETGLEAVAVSDTKGCYLGQEIIARMQTYGSANKKLMGLLVEGNQVPDQGDPILHDGEEAGHVTSACFSPILKRPIAMGYLKRGAYEGGTAVHILQDGKPVAASVAPRPLTPSTDKAPGTFSG